MIVELFSIPEGCSFGASVVMHHVTNGPNSSKFFKRAFAQSAPVGIPYFSDTKAREKYSIIAASLDCCNQNMLEIIIMIEFEI